MIRVLEKDVSDKIAAGEVIERPVSIVKELVENSIDSGANRITVEIKNGGKSYIRVTDNGCGIEETQVRTAFLRHATSKIKDAKDLDRIETLGFRGEALASIAAVTRTELLTKTAESKIGKKIVIHGSAVVKEEPWGCPDGTTIIIEDLFYNTPARRKFLKTDGAEAGRIIDFISQIALTEPEIRFNFINNGRNVFATSGKGNLHETIMEVYKDKDYKSLVPIDYKSEGINVTGYISKPSLSRTSRRSQYFFVNGRVIKSAVIEKGIAEGYKERLFEGRFPIAYIFISTDPSFLDVNIHPNKREIRFDDDRAIIEAVSNAVFEALASEDAIATVKEPKFVYSSKESENLYEQKANENFVTIEKGKRSSNIFKTFPKEEKKEQVDINKLLLEKRIAEQILKEKESSASKESLTLLDVEVPTSKPFDFLELQYVATIFDTYILCQDEDTFYMIDQHAAHERVFYEKLMKEYRAGEKESQLLMIPFTEDVPVEMTEDDGRWRGLLENMGYSLEVFGENTYIIREIPRFMQLGESQAFLKSFIDQYATGNVMENQVVIDKLITRSCKSAIKAHDRISESEAVELLSQLKNCKNPFSCPHGRPTFIKYSLYEIERMFKRA